MGIITGVLLIPVLGILVMLFIPASKTTTSQNQSQLFGRIALIASVLTFLVSLGLITGFDSGQTGCQFVEIQPWIPQFGLFYQVGLDGISLLLVILTTALMPLAILSSFRAIDFRQKEYYIWMLLLEASMLGAFVALNLFLFYIFWELMLVPMFFLIGIWGGKNRIYATIKFVLFTVVGSLMMLAGIIYLALLAQQQFGSYSFSYDVLFQLNIPPQTQIFLFLAFGLAFAIKVPMFPFHTWLPDAHVEAPTAGSVILAGILLKMGGYGFIRLGIPLFKSAALELAPWLQTLAVIGIVYGACLALVQQDLKKLVAYSSISHLGYVMLGLFAVETVAVQGSVIQMVNHGISTGALFLLVGMIYERRHTREISEYGGLARQLPIFSTIFMIITLSSIALPGTNGFIGEFMILLGSFKSAWSHFLVTQNSYRLILVVLATTGVILGAFYMLWLVQRVFFGPLKNEKNLALKDLSWREVVVLTPLVIAVFWIGLFPGQVLRPLEKSVDQFMQQVKPVSMMTRVPAPTSPLLPPK
ncbi:NADH-quinone oxidoreductase subunit M [candidate division KSB1 bacterium]|nr:NADH-quinone oxidoreductase subunit M [candidate division KSB1 bacterium]